MSPKIQKTDAEWRKLLTAQQYYVTREKGTEAPGSGCFVGSHEDGVYACVCCGQELFGSGTKFESGSGWPSYCQPLAADRIIEHKDASHGMIRTEVLCSLCDAHLGHVFDDGPQPTGLRYCINSVALSFQKK